MKSIEEHIYEEQVVEKLDGYFNTNLPITTTNMAQQYVCRVERMTSLRIWSRCYFKVVCAAHAMNAT